jgi:hypothetical protein
MACKPRQNTFLSRFSQMIQNTVTIKIRPHFRTLAIIRFRVYRQLNCTTRGQNSTRSSAAAMNIKLSMFHNYYKKQPSNFLFQCKAKEIESVVVFVAYRFVIK